MLVLRNDRPKAAPDTYYRIKHDIAGKCNCEFLCAAREMMREKTINNFTAKSWVKCPVCGNDIFFTYDELSKLEITEEEYNSLASNRQPSKNDTDTSTNNPKSQSNKRMQFD